MSKTAWFQRIQFSTGTQFKCKYTLIKKKATQFSQAILIQLIQLSIRTDFLYTQLHVKTVLC